MPGRGRQRHRRRLAFLRGRLATYKIPVYVDVVADLPRTGSGKVRKGPLRELPPPAHRASTG
jgi:acyl-CoA synthetase (AMP-forming)/AMP-acid ligase II